MTETQGRIKKELFRAAGSNDDGQRKTLGAE